MFKYIVFSSILNNFVKILFKNTSYYTRRERDKTQPEVFRGDRTSDEKIFLHDLTEIAIGPRSGNFGLPTL